VVGEQKASSYTMIRCACELDLEWRSNSSAKESAKENKCAQRETERWRSSKKIQSPEALSAERSDSQP
jgi:hypothetical protein